MKLKYYLRGVGIGIIFATLVMALSSYAHRYNLSDEYIIKEAKKLGMVMSEDADDKGGLWGSNDSEDLESEMTEDTEVTEVTETTELENSESESETLPDIPVVQEPEPEPEPEQNVPVVDENSDYVTIIVKSGDVPRDVGKQLVAAGMIEDEEEFMRYVSAHGLSNRLRRGTYSVPKNASLEEICNYIF